MLEWGKETRLGLYGFLAGETICHLRLRFFVFDTLTSNLPFSLLVIFYSKERCWLILFLTRNDL